MPLTPSQLRLASGNRQFRNAAVCYGKLPHGARLIFQRAFGLARRILVYCLTCLAMLCYFHVSATVAQTVAQNGRLKLFLYIPTPNTEYLPDGALPAFNKARAYLSSGGIQTMFSANDVEVSYHLPEEKDLRPTPILKLRSVSIEESRLIQHAVDNDANYALILTKVGVIAQPDTKSFIVTFRWSLISTMDATQDYMNPVQESLPVSEFGGIPEPITHQPALRQRYPDLARSYTVLAHCFAESIGNNQIYEYRRLVANLPDDVSQGLRLSGLPGYNYKSVGLSMEVAKEVCLGGDGLPYVSSQHRNLHDYVFFGMFKKLKGPQGESLMFDIVVYPMGRGAAELTKLDFLITNSLALVGLGEALAAGIFLELEKQYLSKRQGTD